MDYLKFFDLAAEPFQNHPDPVMYYESRGQKGARLRLMRGLERRRGLLVVMGPAGCGKTTLATQLRASLPTPPYRVHARSVPHRDCADGWLLPEIARAVGAPALADDPAGTLDQLQRALLLERANGDHSVLIVDEAQLLSSQTAMQEFRGLLNLADQSQPLLSVVMLGLDDLSQALALDPSLEQRIDVRVQIAPMDADEALDYLAHRLQQVGGSRELFSDEALEALAEYARGVPRLLNTLADTALFEAALSESRPVPRESVLAAADQLGLGMPEAAPETPVDSEAPAPVSVSAPASPVAVPTMAPTPAPAPAPAREREVQQAKPVVPAPAAPVAAAAPAPASPVTPTPVPPEAVAPEAPAPLPSSDPAPAPKLRVEPEAEPDVFEFGDDSSGDLPQPATARATEPVSSTASPAPDAAPKPTPDALASPELDLVSDTELTLEASNPPEASDTTAPLESPVEAAAAEDEFDMSALDAATDELEFDLEVELDTEESAGSDDAEPAGLEVAPEAPAASDSDDSVEPIAAAPEAVAAAPVAQPSVETGDSASPSNSDPELDLALDSNLGSDDDELELSLDALDPEPEPASAAVVESFEELELDDLPMELESAPAESAPPAAAVEDDDSDALFDAVLSPEPGATSGEVELEPDAADEALAALERNLSSAPEPAPSATAPEEDEDDLIDMAEFLELDAEEDDAPAPRSAAPSATPAAAEPASDGDLDDLFEQIQLED